MLNIIFTNEYAYNSSTFISEILNVSKNINDANKTYIIELCYSTDELKIIPNDNGSHNLLFIRNDMYDDNAVQVHGINKNNISISYDISVVDGDTNDNIIEHYNNIFSKDINEDTCTSDNKDIDGELDDEEHMDNKEECMDDEEEHVDNTSMDKLSRELADLKFNYKQLKKVVLELSEKVYYLEARQPIYLQPNLANPFTCAMPMHYTTPTPYTIPAFYNQFMNAVYANNTPLQSIKKCGKLNDEPCDPKCKEYNCILHSEYKKDDKEHIKY